MVCTARKKTIFSFSRRPEKMVFPKKMTLEYDLSRIIGKDHVPLSRKYDLNLERHSFSKKYKEIWYFLQAFRKEGLFKKDHAETLSFLYYLERWYFFPENTIFFPWAGSQRCPPKKYMEVGYFLCTRVCATNLVSHTPAKKNQGWPYPAKIRLKVIDILDWHSGKSSSSSVYLHRDLYGRFHVLLPSEKKQET